MLETEIARNRGLEAERNQGFSGVALVIVGIDPSRNGENVTMPLIWTIREKRDKPETKKVAGQISLPGETRKVNNESIGSNILGGLLEVTGNDHIVKNNLFLMERSSLVKGRLFVNSRPFEIIVLIYEGPLDETLQPVDKDEVEANGWMTIRQIQEQNSADIRDFVRDIASLEAQEGIIKQAVSDYFHTPTGRIPVSRILPSNFSSMEAFYREREKSRDVIGISADSKT